MKKFLIVPILFISMILFTGNVFATSTTSSPFPTTSIEMTSGSADYYIGFSNIFNGYYNGTIVFSWLERSAQDFPVNAVYIYTYNTHFVCDIGDTFTYYDNNTQSWARTARCNVSLPENEGVISIRFVKSQTAHSSLLYFSDVITFVADYNEGIYNELRNNNYNSILNAIHSDTTAIMNALQSGTGNEVGAINNNTQAINNQSAQQHADSQAEQNAINNNTQAVNDLNDTISDDDISGNGADGFFNNFQNNDHGLSSIITAPLSFIQNLSSSTCSPISLTLPFVSETFNLPCMSTIYSANFGNLLSLYRTIVFGIVAYYICVRIYALVKGFKDPQDDRIEVLDL